jgi:signal transduction histidine kinase
MIDTDVCGTAVEIVATKKQLPVNEVPQYPSVNGVELDLIQHEGETYLRKRLWDDGNVLVVYHPAGDELPHHRHIRVLHRVFRHNLRNGVNVIQGWAEVIENVAADNPERAAEAAATIAERAEQLGRISDEARRLEKLLHTGTELRSVEIQPVVDQVLAEQTREHQYDSINVDIPDELSVQASDKLRFVIDNLIDNALRHNSNPTVEITAEEAGIDGVYLYIDDDGSGLPAVEKRIITGKCEIDQLNHGSGLGLWLVRWILDTYYAEVDVTTENQAGTTYRIKLNK